MIHLVGRKHWTLIKGEQGGEGIRSLLVVVPWNGRRAVLLTTRINSVGLLAEPLCGCNKEDRVRLIGWSDSEQTGGK